MALTEYRQAEIRADVIKSQRTSTIGGCSFCSGLSATEVAKELKVRKETISRWKNDRDFNEELRGWRLAFFDRLIKRQFALFSEAQQQIEAAFQDSALTSYQKANIALRFISMFSGNMNVNKQLASKKSDLYFKDDKWFL